MAEELFALGEQLRSRLNAVSTRRGARLQWTGIGSLMTAHFQRGEIRAAGDVCAEPELRELFHLDMISRGFYLARRGMLALSLEIGDTEIAAFVAAVEGFIDTYRPLLR